MKKYIIPLTLVLSISFFFWKNTKSDNQEEQVLSENITPETVEVEKQLPATSQNLENTEPLSVSQAQKKIDHHSLVQTVQTPPAQAPPVRPRIVEILNEAKIATKETKVERFPSSQELETRISRIETSMKHSDVILVEGGKYFGKDNEEVNFANAHVASHFILQVREGTNLISFQEKLESLGCEIGGKLGDRNFIVKLKQEPTIENHYAAKDAIESLDEFVSVVEPDYLVYAINTPNDPKMIDLWGMHNSGQTGGTNDKDIDATEAWDIQTGSKDVLVGIIDTGVDRTHEDLVDNMWVNPNEIPNNGIDDDQNGFVDDVYGWDFYSDDNDPQDGDSHGTHCAGTIGAKGNNAKGVSGVCWDVSMVGIRFLGPMGGYTSDAVKSINYATTIGVDLTSNSWGGGGYSSSLKNAIDEAGAQGIGFVAAAGNDAYDNDSFPSYPASYDSQNIISVGAHNHNGQMAWFSQWGQNSVDLFAPGVNILSTVPGGYASYDGTSMATPHVSGAYAAILAANPGWTVVEVKGALMNATEPEDGLAGKCVTGGRLNLFQALSEEVSEENLISVNPADVNFGTVSINQSAEFEFILSNPGNAKTTVNKVYINASSDSFKNLIGHWKLDGDAQDSSGHGHDGQVFNATPTTDRFGQHNQAYAFDGDGDYIEIPHSDTLNSLPISISVWFNASEDNENGGVVSKYIAAHWDGWQINSSYNRAIPHYLRGLDHGVIGKNGEKAFETDFSYNTWNHIVTIFDEEGGRIYKNGQFVVTHDWIGAPGKCAGNTSFQIGRYRTYDPSKHPHSDFNGAIDDVRIYGSSLSDNEVLSLYNNETASSPFSVSLETPLELEPYSATVGKLKFSSDQEGVHQANLIVESDAQNQPQLIVPLMAKVTSTPILEADPETMHFGLLEGQVKSQSLTLSNVGDGELKYQVFVESNEGSQKTNLFGMGYNEQGQLGDGTLINKNIPTEILESKFKSISGGLYYSSFVKENGSLWVTGWFEDLNVSKASISNIIKESQNGDKDTKSIFKEIAQLGAINKNNSESPVEILSFGVNKVSTGYAHSLILKEDGSLWAMGDNFWGQLGDGSWMPKNSPVQIVETGVKDISAGGFHSLFLKEDGSVWAMGDNSWGQLGDGSWDSKNTPTQILSSGVEKISAHYLHNLIIKMDGSTWSFGDNEWGQLGDGTWEAKNTPVQIFQSDIKDVGAGGFHSLFLKEDGSLWATGDNEWGQLGDGTWDTKNSPTIILNSGVKEICVGGLHNFIIKEDNSLWVNGDNEFGQLGDGTWDTKNSPSKLMEVDQINLNGGYLHSFYYKGSELSKEPIWLSVDTNDGSIDPSGSAEITVTADASQLSGDSSTAYIVIESNDPSEPSKTVTVTASMLKEGNGLVFSPEEISFGNTYVGQTSERELTLTNGGTEGLSITHFVFLDSAFSHHLELPLKLEAGEQVKTTLYFEPKTAGDLSTSALVLSDENGKTSYSLSVGGTADFAPGIAVNTDQISETLEMHEEKTVTITITNGGGSQLDWTLKGATKQDASTFKMGKIFGMEHFSPLEKGSVDRRSGTPISKMGGGPDYHGYSWTDSNDPSGPESNWADISESGERLAEVSESDDGYQEVSIPFMMELYGEKFNQMFVNANGYITLGAPSTEHGHFPLPTAMMPGNLVAPFAMDLNPANGGDIYVAKDEKKVVVQYDKVKDFAGLGEYTFQVELHNNGVIFFNYHSVGEGEKYATTGIQNGSSDIGLLVSYNSAQIESGMTVRVSTSPKWLHVADASGSLGAGESQVVELKIKAGEIHQGIYEAMIEVASNDPANASVFVPVTMEIKGTKSLVVNPTEMNFGEVEVGLSKTIQFNVENNGNTPVVMEEFSLSNGAFSSNFSAVTVEPGKTKELEITFKPTDATNYDAIATLQSDAENSPSTIDLVGKGKATAKLSVTPELVKIEVDAGDKASENALLSNLGKAAGEYELIEIRSAEAAQSLTKHDETGKSTETIPDDAFTAEHVADELIVVFKANTTGFENPDNLDGNVEIVRSLANSRKPGGQAQALSSTSMSLVRNKTNLSLRELAAQLKDDAAVEYVEPNYIVRHTEVPNDPQFGDQWALGKIQASEAWKVAKGNHSVTVAVIDTGIDYNHPDLQGNIWTNPGEIPGNNIDDDGNGYIDDIHGWDFCNKDNDPMDGDSHGTHVAGTIAAATNNGQLVSGVAWHTSLVALKFLGDDGSGTTADAIDAVAYCAAMEFPISNNSWGGGGYSQALKDVIAQAAEKGHLFCAAAGNSSTNNDEFPHYPSNYDLPSVLSVAASNDADDLAWFSCFGEKTVDLAAPGANILSLIPNGGTASFSGTSMATPHVAGAAAILLSMNPDFGSQELKNSLMNSVDPVPAFEGKMVSPGRLNLANAISGMSPSWLTVTPETGTVGAGSQANLVFTADATNLYASTKQAVAVFQTNDPLATLLEVPVELTVHGTPVIEVSSTSLDFGTVWLGNAKSKTVTIRNSGTDTLDIADMLLDNGAFSTETAGFSLNPKESKTITIEAKPLASGEENGKLVINSNDTDQPSIEIELRVNGMSPPSLSFMPELVSVTVKKDAKEQSEITITNSGEALGTWNAYLVETGDSKTNKMDMTTALSNIESRVEVPDFRSPRASLLSQAQKSSLKDSDPVVRVESNPDSELEVAVLGAAFDYENEDILNGLVATELFGGVTMINVKWVTPTVQELSVFDAVLLYSIDPYADPDTLGDVIAEYALAGGGVVTASHEGNTHSIQGKWLSQELNVYESDSNYIEAEGTLGTTLVEGHPIMINVENFKGKSRHVRENPTTPAYVVASWDSGTPLVTVRDGLAKVADLSFWPVSDQADGLGYFPGWDSSTDGWQLIANSLKWVTLENEPKWLSADELIGSVAGNQEEEMKLFFDANSLSEGNYTAEVHFVTNDPAQAFTRVEVIMIVKENQPPVAVSNTITVQEDQSITFELEGSDPDADGISYEVITLPSNGVLTGDAPTLTYTPKANFNGQDSLTFKVSDGSLESKSAELTIIVEPVNDAPWAGSTEVNATEDEFFVLEFLYGDIDGDALEVTITKHPEHGFLWEEFGTTLYFPDPHYNGNDEVRFLVSDGQTTSNEATVSINLEPTNDAPVSGDLTFETLEDQSVVIELNATDVDGDKIAYDIITDPSHGKLTFMDGKSWEYTPYPEFSGIDQFTFRATDSQIQGNLATATIHIHEQNDAPVIQSSTFVMQEDEVLKIKLIASDPDGDSLSFEVIQKPTNGTLVGNGPNYDYLPTENFFGNDSFIVKASDGELESNATTINLVVNPTNDAPSFASSKNSVHSGLRETPYRMKIPVEDADSDELTLTIAENPENGSCYFDGEELVFLPNPGFDGVDTVMLELSDGSVSVQSKFSINVKSHENPVSLHFNQEDDSSLINMLYQANEILANNSERIFELKNRADEKVLTARVSDQTVENAMNLDEWLDLVNNGEATGDYAFTKIENENGLNWKVAPFLAPSSSADTELNNEDLYT